jgi:beta-phosphoglucomutase-like phosphatase (HAD superfamily)
MIYRGIVFDFNGTLLWDMDLHEQVWNEVSRHHRGRPFTDDEWHHQVVGRTNAEVASLVLGHQPSAAETEAFSEEKEEAYRELLVSLPHRVTLVDGAVELFEACLGAGIEIAIGTAAGKSNVDFYVKTFGLLKWFKRERIVYDDGTMPGKPDPALFSTAIQRLGVAPASCIVVEDGVLGIRAARAAGAGKVYGIWASEADRAKLSKVPLERIIHTYREMSLDDFR